MVPTADTVRPLRRDPEHSNVLVMWELLLRMLLCDCTRMLRVLRWRVRCMLLRLCVLRVMLRRRMSVLLRRRVLLLLRRRVAGTLVVLRRLMRHMLRRVLNLRMRRMSFQRKVLQRMVHRMLGSRVSLMHSWMTLALALAVHRARLVSRSVTVLLRGVWMGVV